MSTKQDKEKVLPPQHQDVQPGREMPMTPPPASFMEGYTGSGRLDGKVALVTGGDSGIGRAVAIAFAKEGADVAIAFLEECEDARQTRHAIEKAGRKGLSLQVDLRSEEGCRTAVDATVRDLGRLDILVNNAAEQHPQDTIEKITADQLERTFRTNVFSMFHCVRAALPHLRRRSTHHQHDLGDRVPRQSSPSRLFGDEGGDRCVHPFARPVSRQTRHPSQRGRAGPHLDARLFPPRSTRKRSRPSVRKRRWGVPGSRMKWRRASFSSLPRALPT